MHKHENKSHRMQLIDLCAEVMACAKLDIEWYGQNSHECYPLAKEILSILTIDPDKLKERIDKKMLELAR